MNSRAGVPPAGTGEESIPSGGTTAAARVADVLLAVATSSEQIGVTEISRKLGVSKAVVHRVLRSLASRQLVRVDASEGAYTLGPAAVALGARALGELDLRRLAMPVLSELQAETGETATVSALVGTTRVFLDQVVSHEQVRMTVELGRPYPLHAGATGRAILAAAPEDLCRRVLAAERPALTEATVVDRAALERLLEESRQLGFSFSAGERQEGAGGIASPIFGLDGDVAGAAGVCGPAHRFTPEVVAAVGPSVRGAAERLSAALSHPSPGGQGAGG